MSSKVTEVQSEAKKAKPSQRGVLYVVSSPSGGGKGTIIKRVLDVMPDLSYSVSYTTRAPRNGEVDGREYFFVNRATFEEMVAAGEFLEVPPLRTGDLLAGTAATQEFANRFVGKFVP